LEDVDYMHHEVDHLTYDLAVIGNYYPIYFSAFSHYPFTAKARITMM
jgi:hypothetical protein